MRLRRSGRGQAPASARDRMYSPLPHATAPPRRLLPIDDDGQLPDQLGDAISVDKQLGEVVIEDDREISRSGVKLIRSALVEYRTRRDLDLTPAADVLHTMEEMGWIKRDPVPGPKPDKWRRSQQSFASATSCVAADGGSDDA